MKPRTFFLFVGPSLALMLVFIAIPLVSVFVQSFHVEQPVYRQVETERCTPGFPAPICTKETRTASVIGADGRPVTQRVFVGFDTYRVLLAPERLAAAFAPGGGGWRALLTIDFYKALRFTLTFTLITLPLVIGLGLAIAIAVDSVVQSLRGPIIFVSLLPFIITPVIGALAIRWLFVGDGILTRAIEFFLERDIAVFAQGWSIELLMLFYRVWHVAPFAFVVFYAALQTVNQDSLDAALVDGASRFERLRYVILPHLAPLIAFVALIHLMDAYRVFDEVIGFSSEAHVISLQWLTFHYLTPEGSADRSIARASASAMLTMVGIVLLLVPLLRRTWREHRRLESQH
ncbi:MAG: sugar ABC transporter permease [Alphaproteobacteria bacterium]|nr:sugar ABC transporter permease [Alphaproteobacteria bacterium]